MLNHICGHRDGGSTLCPGENLYAQLPVIRPDTDSLYHDPSGLRRHLAAGQRCLRRRFAARECRNLRTRCGHHRRRIGLRCAHSGLQRIYQRQCAGCVVPVYGNRFETPRDGDATGARRRMASIPWWPCTTPTVPPPQLIQCIDAPGGPGGLTILNLENLTPGQQYRIRVFDFGNAPAANGRFNICVLTGASVGIAEAGVSGAWHIYPNPATGWVTVQLSETFYRDGLLRVLNIGGIPVREQRLTQRETRIDLSGLPAGLYLVELQTEAGAEWRRVVLR
jgi:hypothetical protein